MNRFPAVLLVLATMALPATAADRALIEEDDVWNLYTTLELKTGSLGDDAGNWAGVQVGGLLNDHLGIGVGGTLLVGDSDPGIDGYSTVSSGDAWYAGVLADYTFNPEGLWHVAFGVFGGAGEMDFTRTSGNGLDELSFWLIEPALSLMINVTPTAELGLRAGYRFSDARNNDAGNAEGDELAGFVASILLRLTEF